MANESQAQPPHQSVRSLLTENPKSRVPNGCASSTTPSPASTRCRCVGELIEQRSDAGIRHAELSRQFGGAVDPPLGGELTIDAQAQRFGVGHSELPAFSRR